MKLLELFFFFFFAFKMMEFNMSLNFILVYEK